MVVKKCDFKGCEKAGTCRCPKDRRLSEYWWFCQKHAAEYNKNWNYYAGMTIDEINKEWEKDMFGENKKSNFDHHKFMSDFINGRAGSTAGAHRKHVSAAIANAFATMGSGPSDDWEKIQKKYRALAKQEHPDTGKSKDQSRFVKISNAYQALKKHFGK
jgi:hypothetical protein